MKKQRIMGLLLMMISVGMMLFAMTQPSLESQDISAVVVLIPLGLFLQLSRQTELVHESRVRSDSPVVKAHFKTAYENVISFPPESLPARRKKSI